MQILEGLTATWNTVSTRYSKIYLTQEFTYLALNGNGNIVLSWPELLFFIG